MMDGELTLESEVGLGSTFIVEFTDIAFSKDKEFKDEIELKDLDQIDFKPANVLVVDDVESNRKLLELILRKYPLEIYLATNGKEAVDLTRR